MTFGCEDPHHCVTCADEGVAMRVVAVDAERGLALCRAPGGARESVEIALVDAVAPGDALLVHAGTALTRLDPAEGGRSPSGYQRLDADGWSQDAGPDAPRRYAS